jgi:predicted metal-dependent hydrolase
VTQKPRVIKQGNVMLGLKIIPYTLKRSMRANLIWLVVKPDQSLVVTVPRRYDICSLEEYLLTKSDWILRTIERIERRNQAAKTMNSSNSILYLGERLQILKRSNQNKLMEIKVEKDHLVVDLDSSLKKQHKMEIERWLIERANERIDLKTQFLSEKTGFGYNKLSIRRQKSTWGSCSRRRNLSFNWRLIMAPESILEYVIIHELCHLQEMNHSDAFWKLVSKYCPDWKQCRKWLNQHRLDLQAPFNLIDQNL